MAARHLSTWAVDSKSRSLHRCCLEYGQGRATWPCSPHHSAPGPTSAKNMDFLGGRGGGVWREKDGCGKEGLEQALTSPSFIKWGFREKSGEGNTLQQYDYLYFSVLYSLRPINPTFPLPELVYSTPSPYPRYEMSARFQRVWRAFTGMSRYK